MAMCEAIIFSFCQPCAVLLVVKTGLDTVVTTGNIGVDISEHIYGETVDVQDDAAASEQHSAVYENVITIHGNVIQTFNQLSRVLTIVSGSPTGQSSRRRLQVIDCINTTLGEDVDNCSKPFCDKPEKLCDGRINYEYISQRKNGENHNRKL